MALNRWVIWTQIVLCLLDYQEFVGHRIVDAVLEDIRWSLEFPISKFNQRRVSIVKYLAELYNYRMVESSVIFKVCITPLPSTISISNVSGVSTRSN